MMCLVCPEGIPLKHNIYGDVSLLELFVFVFKSIFSNNFMVFRTKRDWKLSSFCVQYGFEMASWTLNADQSKLIEVHLTGWQTDFLEYYLEFSYF